MSQFAILRFKKLKTIQCLATAAKHNHRTRETPNANAKLTVQNEHLVKRGDSVAQAWKDIIEEKGIKLRKNGVAAIEVVQTFSPEKQDDIKAQLEEWKKANIDFLEEKFGKDNILDAVLHKDESTYHIHSLIIPITEKYDKRLKKEVAKLNARDFIGGKGKLISMQDSYAKSMAKFDLVRGIKNSKATHQTVKKFYSEVKQDAREIRKLENELAKNLTEINSTNNLNIFKKASLLDNLRKLIVKYTAAARLSIKKTRSELNKALKQNKILSKNMHNIDSKLKDTQKRLKSTEALLEASGSDFRRVSEELTKLKYSNLEIADQAQQKEDPKDVLIQKQQDKIRYLQKKLNKNNDLEH